VLLWASALSCAVNHSVNPRRRSSGGTAMRLHPAWLPASAEVSSRTEFP